MDEELEKDLSWFVHWGYLDCTSNYYGRKLADKIRSKTPMIDKTHKINLNRCQEILALLKDRANKGE